MLSGAFCGVDLDPRSDPLVILADTNGHLGSVVSDAVSDLGAEVENGPGAAFHSRLLTAGLCVPSTFFGRHSGPTVTWHSTSGSAHRLDYVAVPQEWLSSASSRTLDTLESLQLHDDHVPAALTCSFQKAVSTQPYQPFHRRTALRPFDSTDPGELQVFSHLLRMLPAVPWASAVDSHFDVWTTQWNRAWQDSVTGPCRRTVQTYVTDGTASLIAQRKAFRRYLSQETAELARRRLLFGFAAFLLHANGHEFAPGAVATLHYWLRQMHCSIAKASFWLRKLGCWVRHGVRKDRREYLDTLASEVTVQDLRHPRQLYAAVRRAFPLARSSRRSAFVPLPKVELANGDVAVDTASRMERWREHFSEQEAGLLVEGDDYIAAFARQRTLVHMQGPCFDVSCLPTLREVQHVMLGLARRKAAGPDAVVAETLQLCVEDLARSLLPLFLKSAMGVREPVAFRGGHLICLAKRAHSVFACDAFRSVLVSSVPGKVLHRVWRAKLQPVLRQQAAASQAGALPGVSTEALTLFAQAFCGVSRAQGRLPALLFFDLKAAYYRAIRQTIVRFAMGRMIAGIGTCCTH